MPEQLKPTQLSHAQTLREEAGKRLSRSPHPYHKQRFELPFSLERLNANGTPSLRSTQTPDDEGQGSPRGLPEEYRESPNSDSGTEADDEHFLKGLPAPKLRPHKGLRGGDGSPSSSPSPLLSPVLLEGDKGTRRVPGRTSAAIGAVNEEEARKVVEKIRQKRRVEVIRRATEAGILLFVGSILCLNTGVKELLWVWKRGMLCICILQCRH